MFEALSQTLTAGGYFAVGFAVTWILLWKGWL